MGAVLYGNARLNLIYQHARRMRAHRNIDRAEESVETIETKDEAYAARVKSDALFRAAEYWSPSEFGRTAVAGAGLNITIQTSLGPAEESPQIADGGYTIPLLNAKEVTTPDAASDVERP
jgi:hypothetical protein